MSADENARIKHAVGYRAAVGADVEIAARRPVAPCRAFRHGQIRYEGVGMIENEDTPIADLVVRLHSIGDDNPRRIRIVAKNANGGSHVQRIRDFIETFGDMNRRAVGGDGKRLRNIRRGGRGRGIRRRCVFCSGINIHIAVVKRREGVGDGVCREDTSAFHRRRSSRKPLVGYAITEVVCTFRKCLSRRSRAERQLRPVFAVDAVEH